jgi:Interferon-induced transmembrane protein
MGYPQQYPPQGQPPQIDNNMTMSIVSIFLFWPLAIPAIINASKVNPALQTGDYATAQQAAAESKKWSKLALIIGLSAWALGILCCIGWFAFVSSTVATIPSNP